MFSAPSISTYEYLSLADAIEEVRGSFESGYWPKHQAKKASAPASCIEFASMIIALLN